MVHQTILHQDVPLSSLTLVEGRGVCGGWFYVALASLKSLCLFSVFKILMRTDGSGEWMGEPKGTGFACTVKNRRPGSITNLFIAWGQSSLAHAFRAPLKTQEQSASLQGLAW